ncbi:MAG: glucose-1-phosphate adenylyltransferase subunit GlgD [Lachnospiraceae bacterium]|nr:glucose-1-phosphate adenylyltransferase subunit GlgD [Lachnospiraceae bacterium]
MKTIGIILAGGNSKKLGALSDRRATAAMPVAGSYRAIDFALSSMSNSGMQKVGVITQYNSKSLHEHLSSSKWWDFGRKQGGLYTFTPTLTNKNDFWYRGTADAIYQNIDFLKKSHEPYVAIAAGDGIYKLNYNDVLKYHIEKGADITIVAKDMAGVDEDITRFGIIEKDETGAVVGFEEKPENPKTTLVSTGIYIMRRRHLISELERCAEEGKYDLVKDIMLPAMAEKRAYVFELSGYWKNISTVDAYAQVNKDFLKKEVRDYFFKQHPGIYTQVADLPPAKYNEGSSVKNSIVATGCVINGSVEGSVLFKDVYVGNNVTIKNSIILNDVYIGDNTVLENCIVESRDTLRPGTNYVGEDGYKIVVEKNERYIL